MSRLRIKWHYLKNIETILQQIEESLGGTADTTGVSIPTNAVASAAINSLGTSEAASAGGSAVAATSAAVSSYTLSVATQALSAASSVSSRSEEHTSELQSR